MKRREVILLIITVIIIGGGLYLFFEPEPSETGPTAALSTADLGAVRNEFAENLKFLRKGKEINGRYNQLSVSLEDTHSVGMDPGHAAENQLSKVLRERLGIATPNIQNSTPESIKNVDEYYFINIPFEVSGTEADMKRLLREMEAMGFLIQVFKMNGSAHGQTDNVTMNVTVSRLVKHDEESKRRLGLTKKAWTRGR